MDLSDNSGPSPWISLLIDLGLGRMLLILPYSLFRTGLFRLPMCPSGDTTKKITDPVSALQWWQSSETCQVPLGGLWRILAAAVPLQDELTRVNCGDQKNRPRKGKGFKKKSTVLSRGRSFLTNVIRATINSKSTCPQIHADILPQI